MKVALHWPGAEGLAIGGLRLAAVVPNLWAHQEYPAYAKASNGQLEIPTEPGLGVRYEPRFSWRSRKL